MWLSSAQRRRLAKLLGVAEEDIVVAAVKPGSPLTLVRFQAREREREGGGGGGEREEGRARRGAQTRARTQGTQTRAQARIRHLVRDKRYGAREAIELLEFKFSISNSV